jgi:hypothetical protein
MVQNSVLKMSILEMAQDAMNARSLVFAIAMKLIEKGMRDIGDHGGGSGGGGGGGGGRGGGGGGGGDVVVVVEAFEIRHPITKIGVTQRRNFQIDYQIGFRREVEMHPAGRAMCLTP